MAAIANAMTAKTPLNVSFCKGFRMPTLASNGYKATSKRTINVSPNNGTSVCIWSGLIVQSKNSTRPFISVACSVHREPCGRTEVTSQNNILYPFDIIIYRSDMVTIMLPVVRIMTKRPDKPQTRRSRPGLFSYPIFLFRCTLPLHFPASVFGTGPVTSYSCAAHT